VKKKVDGKCEKPRKNFNLGKIRFRRRTLDSGYNKENRKCKLAGKVA